MKTIKVIDLLNMIANKEYDKLPKKVECENYIYEFDERFGDYAYPNKGGVILAFLFSKILNTSDVNKVLNQELEIVEEPILDDKEKAYLSAVVRPFRDQVKFIEKVSHQNKKEYIVITYDEKENQYCNYLYILFPLFEKGTMYKGMEPNTEYSLEELGI